MSRKEIEKLMDEREKCPTFRISLMGIELNIDEEFEAELHRQIHNQVQIVMQKENFHQTVAALLLRNPEYAKRMFRPIIREIINDMDFTASLDFNDDDQ